jgi:hypothetical protein
MKAEWTTARRPTGVPNLSVALAWHIASPPNRDEIVWHNGGTGGYRSYMGFDPKTGVGVVVLTNAATARGGDDIGAHILNGAPLAPTPPDPAGGRHAIALAPQALEALVGRYQFAPGVVLAVTRKDAQLFIQLTGQSPSRVFPESPTAFFSKLVDAQFTFDVPPSGRAAAVTLHQNGRTPTAKRIAEP